MNTVNFEWDENKNDINKRKHGISFEVASTVFFDDDAILADDPDHSQYEDRFLIIGMAATDDVLTVVHCYRDDDNVIRLISARKATKQEERSYFR